MAGSHWVTKLCSYRQWPDSLGQLMIKDLELRCNWIPSCPKIACVGHMTNGGDPTAWRDAKWALGDLFWRGYRWTGYKPGWGLSDLAPWALDQNHLLDRV
jgi:hypothetical protein